MLHITEDQAFKTPVDLYACTTLTCAAIHNCYTMKSDLQKKSLVLIVAAFRLQAVTLTDTTDGVVFSVSYAYF